MAETVTILLFALLIASSLGSIAWAHFARRVRAECAERVRKTEADCAVRLAASEHHGLLVAEAVRLLSEEVPGLRMERDHANDAVRPLMTASLHQEGVIASQAAELAVRDIERAELLTLRSENPSLAAAAKDAEKARRVAERRYLEILNATDAALQDRVVSQEEADQIGALVKGEVDAIVAPMIAAAVEEQAAHEKDTRSAYDIALRRRCIHDRVGKKLAARKLREPADLKARIMEIVRG